MLKHTEFRSPYRADVPDLQSFVIWCRNQEVGVRGPGHVRDALQVHGKSSGRQLFFFFTARARKANTEINPCAWGELQECCSYCMCVNTESKTTAACTEQTNRTNNSSKGENLFHSPVCVQIWFFQTCHHMLPRFWWVCQQLEENKCIHSFLCPQKWLEINQLNEYKFGVTAHLYW